MFERNRIDNVEHTGLPVEITLADGEIVAGRLLLATGKSLADVLNGPSGFLEVEPWAGERHFLAKSQVRNLKLVRAPAAQSLAHRVSTLDGFDPHAILGVPASATLEDVKAAWHRLSKAYHPDRYASADLPKEVAEYLAAMVRRINAAYATLEGPLALKRKAQAMRTEPVYTSGARA